MLEEEASRATWDLACCLSSFQSVRRLFRSVSPPWPGKPRGRDDPALEPGSPSLDARPDQNAALISTTSMTFLLMNSWMPRLVNS